MPLSPDGAYWLCGGCGKAPAFDDAGGGLVRCTDCGFVQFPWEAAPDVTVEPDIVRLEFTDEPEEKSLTTRVGDILFGDDSPGADQ